MSVMPMKHTTDPATDLKTRIGSLQDFELFGPKVLVAIYVRPEVTKGGIHLPGKVRDEDLYQGKIGLVVKKGPLAFKDDDWFGNVLMEEGDWVGFRASDGFALVVNGVQCRILEDVRVLSKVSHPDAIW